MLSGSEEALFSYLRTRASFAREATVLESLPSIESVRSLEAPEAEVQQFDDRHLARAFGTTVQQVNQLLRRWLLCAIVSALVSNRAVWCHVPAKRKELPMLLQHLLGERQQRVE